jgi:hypothetical protein
MVTRDEDAIHVVLFHIAQHGLQRGQVAVHIGQNCQTQGCPPPTKPLRAF